MPGRLFKKTLSSPIGYLTLAMIHQDDKELDKAIEILKKASQINDIRIYMMIGNVYFQKKDYKAALEEYRKAESLKSGYLPALFHQGSVLHTMGRKKEAILKYQKALSLSQNHIPTLNNLAYLYAEDNNNLAMALQLAAKAYTLAPTDGYVQDTLGFVLLKNGKKQRRINCAEKSC